MTPRHTGFLSAVQGRRARPLARAVSWLATLALLAMMVMPLAGALAGPANGATLVTICSDHGIEQVALDAEGRSIPLQKAHHHHRACPFCVSHSGAAPLPTAVIVPTPLSPAGITAVEFADSGFVPAPVFLSGRETRAPPAPVI